MRLLFLVILSLPVASFGETATVATSANFRATMAALGDAFNTRTPHELVMVSGSTGQLYAQIQNGAPFDVFLAADQDRPAKLENGPYAVANSRFTYAIGRLAVVARDEELLKDTAEATLAQAGIARLVIANPSVAPYGVAARQVLHSLALDDGHFGLIAYGENVAQAMTMVRTGNADLGLISVSVAKDRTAAGNLPYVIVPDELHAPVRQDAILLSRGRDNAAALAFLAFLDSADGRRIIEAAGYGLE